jgi:hypothetical protein
MRGLVVTASFLIVLTFVAGAFLAGCSSEDDSPHADLVDFLAGFSGRSDDDVLELVDDTARGSGRTSDALLGQLESAKAAFARVAGLEAELADGERTRVQVATCDVLDVAFVGSPLTPSGFASALAAKGVGTVTPAQVEWGGAMEDAVAAAITGDVPTLGATILHWRYCSVPEQ